MSRRPCWRYCWRESKICNEKRRRTHRPAAFLAEQGSYLGIAECVEAVMDAHEREGVQKVESLEQLQALVDEAAAQDIPAAQLLDPLLMPMDSPASDYPLVNIPETSAVYFKNGNPVEVKETSGKHIPCNFTTNKNDHLGRYEGGTFTRAKFVVLIDMQEFDAEYIILNTARGAKVGKFRVQDIQSLDVVGNVRITVE